MRLCSRYIKNKKNKLILLGFSTIVTEPLNGGNTTATSIMLDRGENLLHRYYGQYHFWAARRAMRFSSELREFANEYRKTHFNSDDVSDKTDIWNKNWDEVENMAGQAIGGQYLAVHLRRKDFLRARAKVRLSKFREVIHYLGTAFNRRSRRTNQRIYEKG